jgi:hypothetical protein
VSRLTEAWQRALAAEQEAVFGYGVLGPHLAKGDLPLAYECVSAHEDLRDATVIALTAARQTPVSPQADYPSLYPVTDPASARRLAVRLEDDCATAWRYLYLQAASARTSSAAALRRSAQGGLTASAVRAVRWRGRVNPAQASTPFPGA